MSDIYLSGCVSEYREWIGKYANQTCSYFAKHTHGASRHYQFNSLGFRGPEFYIDPDIIVVGSSFSFGVGIEFEQCWHQLLGNLRVNCYATAGFIMTNNDILDLAASITDNSARMILQLRESCYNRAKLDLPLSTDCFAIDQQPIPNMFTLGYDTVIDHAEDGIHPGPLTHQSWAKTLRHKFGW